MTEWTDLDQAYLEEWGHHPGLSDAEATMLTMRRNVTVPAPADRPSVEVLVEGRGWVAGEVRMQWRAPDDAWWAEVQFRSPDHHSTMIDAFPAERVRKDEADHSRGRPAGRLPPGAR
jgi:hypothetical protein